MGTLLLGGEDSKYIWGVGVRIGDVGVGFRAGEELGSGYSNYLKGV